MVADLFYITWYKFLIENGVAKFLGIFLTGPVERFIPIQANIQREKHKLEIDLSFYRLEERGSQFSKLKFGLTFSINKNKRLKFRKTRFKNQFYC